MGHKNNLPSEKWLNSHNASHQSQAGEKMKYKYWFSLTKRAVAATRLSAILHEQYMTPFKIWICVLSGVVKIYICSEAVLHRQKQIHFSRFKCFVITVNREHRMIPYFITPYTYHVCYYVSDSEVSPSLHSQSKYVHFSWSGMSKI